MLQIKYRSHEKEILIFKKYLGDNLDIVSFSAIIKKLPFILRDLSTYSNYTRWKTVITLTETEAKIEIINNKKTGNLSVYIFTFSHTSADFPKLSKLLENIMKQLKKKFNLDKNNMPSVISLVDGTKFIFNLYENNDINRLIEIDIRSVKLSLKEKLSLWFYRHRHPEKDFNEVLMKQDLVEEIVL